MATFGPKAWFYPFGKMSIFMVLTHGFGPKMGLLPTFFQAIQALKMSFTIFQNEKTPFEAIKTRSSKSRKIDIFLGMVHGIGPKNGHFSNFFIQIISTRKMSFTILQNQETPFQASKTRSSKSRKIDIFPWNGPWNWSKNGHFSNFFFQAIQALKMSFTIIQNEKTPFQAKKTRSSKSLKNDIFPKGLTHGFGPRMAICPTIFFRQDRPGKCLLRDSRTKKRLSRPEYMKFKQSKN